jgi:predicted GNAT superfamily acetyltransferase
MITNIKTYYIKVDNKNAKAACSPLSAPPKWGWVADAIKVQKKIQIQNQKSKLRTERLQDILRREITTLFSTAFVIDDYNRRNSKFYVGKCVLKTHWNYTILVRRLVEILLHPY